MSAKSSLTTLLLLAISASPAAALGGPPAHVTRRAVVAGLSALGLAKQAHPAYASYAMQQAAVASHTWEATGKENETAVYNEIEQSLDQKRRFRPELGELGYVGGEYTKKASADRAKYDEAMKRSAEKTQQALGAMGYARAEDYLFK